VALAAETGPGSSRAPLSLLGDERLARLAAAGHERAFSVVYERHHQALYRYCRSILRDDADAQDALQSTFTAAFAALERGPRDVPIRPWLFRIAHNEAVSVLRRRRPTAELSTETDPGTISVEDQVAERAELALLLRDLRELHERQRSALVMRELSGLSHEDIALALQTSVGAAKQAIYEARRSLFEFAEGRAMPCDEIQRTLSDADGRLLRSRRVRAHLRECSGCAAFAAAIPARRRELRALVPVLPAAAAARLLERAADAGAGAGASHGAGTGLAGLATGAAGKAAGAALAANALAGVAVVASATVGVTIGLDKLTHATAHATAAHHVASTRAVAAPKETPTRTAVPTAPPISRQAGSAPLQTVRSVASGTSTPTRTSGRPPRSVATRTHPPTSATAPADSSGHGAMGPGASSFAPGHSIKTSTSPGHSSSAPGHTAKTSTSPGHSSSAPGHTKSSSHTSSSPFHSSSPPGQSAKTSAGSGHSGSAPGHIPSTGVAVPQAVRTVATVPAVPAIPGTAKSVPPGRRK
jgi:RNA polymerase sigma factor (sigma-70 family)